MDKLTEGRAILLVLAVVQATDAEAATDALTALGVGVTQVHSSGGFLRQGNVTLLSGVDSTRLNQVLVTLRRTCHHRLEYVAVPLEGGNMPFAFPMEVEVGGATVFVFPVERYEEI
jgi:uncharacterized protein YaaQ